LALYRAEWYGQARFDLPNAGKRSGASDRHKHRREEVGVVRGDAGHHQTHDKHVLGAASRYRITPRYGRALIRQLQAAA
jgi:hypothetical protein